MQGVWAVPEQGRYESAIHRGGGLDRAPANRSCGGQDHGFCGSASPPHDSGFSWPLCGHPFKLLIWMVRSIPVDPNSQTIFPEKGAKENARQ